jgi:hypothetical protein
MSRARARARSWVLAPLVPVALLLTVLVATVLLGGPAAGADAGTPRHGAEPVAYEAPVDASVTDPFRPPATRYGRGNRGLEYDAPAGMPVRAAAAGTVTFAGQVGGTRYVTVLHADGLRTTYGPLARVGVARGADVEAGAVVGVAAGGGLLWTARLGSAYDDPAALLRASGGRHVHLVPDRPRNRLGAR